MKSSNKYNYRYLIQLKGEAITKVSMNDLKEVGQFYVFGTTGVGLQGYTDLKADELKNYICVKYNVAPESIMIINPS